MPEKASAGQPSKSATTRLKLMVAAERLFVERGFAEVSLEDVAKAGGQRNKSAVNYHFGGREGLIRAIVEYRFDQAQLERRKIMAFHQAAGSPTTVRSLLGEVLLPVAQSIGPDTNFGRFQAKYALLRGELEASHRIQTQSDALRSLLSHLTPEVFDARWRMVVNAYVMAMAHLEQALASGSDPAIAAVTIKELLDFSAGGLMASSDDLNS